MERPEHIEEYERDVIRNLLDNIDEWRSLVKGDPQQRQVLVALAAYLVLFPRMAGAMIMMRGDHVCQVIANALIALVLEDDPRNKVAKLLTHDCLNELINTLTKDNE